MGRKGATLTAVRAAANYCRINQDRDGTTLGVQRQEVICRDLAARKGWPVAEVYVDNDLSAYSGKPRPAYLRMLADVEAGLRDAVLVVDTDRLTRQPAELEDFIALADARDIALANAAGDVDLATSDGRFKARIMGAMSRMESEKKSERLRRERAQRATAGRPHPGPRAFGFEEGNEAHRGHEADLIREAARMVLAGRSVRSVADAWNAAGVTTARGNRWTVGAVTDLLTTPRLAGLREHQGEVVGEAAWPAILERETWERLVALARARRRGPGRPQTRLLTGLVFCGRCGGPMRSSGSKGSPTYACQRRPGNDACGRLSVNADHLDGEVRDQVLTAIASGRLGQIVEAERHDTNHRDLVADLEADEAALVDLSTDHYVHRRIGKAEFLAAREGLSSRIAAIKARLAAGADRGALQGLPAVADDLTAWWETAPGDLRRAVVAKVIERIDIRPLDPSKPRRFDPERAAITWRA